MSADSSRILIVDDEPMVREVLCEYLTHAGYTVDEAGDGLQAVELAAATNPDLILLDLMLPGLHGLEVLRTIRRTSQCPVILLSALGEEKDRVTGLEFGADDYVVKPFSPREVTARVRSVLRRSVNPDPIATEITFGDVHIDTVRHEVSRNGEAVELTKLEFDLLVHFASNPGQVFEREDLLRAVWGSSEEWQDPSTVTVHLRRLRQKIETDASEPRHLVTVYGVGYRFDP